MSLDQTRGDAPKAQAPLLEALRVDVQKGRHECGKEREREQQNDDQPHPRDEAQLRDASVVCRQECEETDRSGHRAEHERAPDTAHRLLHGV